MFTLKTISLRGIRLSAYNVYRNSSANKNLVIEEDEDEDKIPRPTFLDDELVTEKEVKRDRSRLLPQHRNMLHEQLPYNEPQSWIHLTEKYQRKMFGRYGASSGVNARICFPTEKDMQETAVKTKLLEPYTLKEMLQKEREAEEAKRAAIEKREYDIALKLSKLDQWKQELNDKIAKKEADALAVKERKERLVEEVRRHFGFKVDPRDDRFKEMLEQKEKEQKRKDKEARRKVKEDKMMAKLLAKQIETKDIDSADK